MNFKNKKEFVEFIKNQMNIELKNEKCTSNSKRKFLYTEIPQLHKLPLLSYLTKLNIWYESHLNNYYWIKIKD